MRSTNSWRVRGWWVHALAHELLQADKLSVQFLQASISALFLSIDGLWNQVLQATHFVGDAAGVVFALAAGGLELGNHGFNFQQRGVEALSALLLGGLQCLGVLGELIKQ